MSRKKGKVIPMTLRQEEKEELEEFSVSKTVACDCVPRWYLVAGRKPRDLEAVELFKKLIGPDPLPQR